MGFNLKTFGFFTWIILIVVGIIIYVLQGDHTIALWSGVLGWIIPLAGWMLEE